MIRRDAAAAVAAAAPHVVVCSWMPLGVDWTAAFRACPSVASYLLVRCRTPHGCNQGGKCVICVNVYDGSASAIADVHV